MLEESNEIEESQAFKIDYLFKSVDEGYEELEDGKTQESVTKEREMTLSMKYG